MITYVFVGPLIGVFPYISWLTIASILDNGVTAIFLSLEFYQSIFTVALGLTIAAYIYGLPAAIINGLFRWWYIEHNYPIGVVRKTLFCIISSFIIVFIIFYFFNKQKDTITTIFYLSLRPAIFYSMSSLLAIYVCDKLISHHLKKNAIDL